MQGRALGPNPDLRRGPNDDLLLYDKHLIVNKIEFYHAISKSLFLGRTTLHGMDPTRILGKDLQNWLKGRATRTNLEDLLQRVLIQVILKAQKALQLVAFLHTKKLLTPPIQGQDKFSGF